MVWLLNRESVINQGAQDESPEATTMLLIASDAGCWGPIRALWKDGPALGDSSLLPVFIFKELFPSAGQ